MDDYENLYKDVSNQNVDTADLNVVKKNVIKTVSIITIVLLQPSL